MKKILLISVMVFILVSGVAAYNVDVRIGLGWARSHIADPNTASSVSKGDADINGLGISIGTTVEYYNSSAFWADASFVFPGDFRFNGATIPVLSNSYLFYADYSAGAALTFDSKSMEFYLGIGYSFCELLYRFNLTNSRYREYSLSASGPSAYLAAKLDVGKGLSLQLTAIPKLTIFTSRVTRDKGGYSAKDKTEDFLFKTGFEVNASFSLVYTF